MCSLVVCSLFSRPSSRMARARARPYGCTLQLTQACALRAPSPQPGCAGARTQAVGVGACEGPGGGFQGWDGVGWGALQLFVRGCAVRSCGAGPGAGWSAFHRVCLCGCGAAVVRGLGRGARCARGPMRVCDSSCVVYPCVCIVHTVYLMCLLLVPVQVREAEDEAERERLAYQAVDWCVLLPF